MSTTAPLDTRWTPEAAGRQNMLQLTHLRWVAVAGQLVTVLFVQYGLGVRLPLAPMLAIVGALLLLNVASVLLLRRERATSDAALFGALILDVALLTGQLYLSGGATNPFVSLYLLQVVLGAILLGGRSTIAIVALSSLCFALLTRHYRVLDLPPALARHSGTLNVIGEWICFALIATLLVLFVTRINRNLSARDAHLAALRQHAAEEDHIVRMGLLASGAAHELGTPLASLAVILGDWKRLSVLADQPDLLDDIAEMQAELDRCKAIVTGVLLAAGEARGEAPAVTTLNAFVDDVAAAWAKAHPGTRLDLGERVGADVAIVADTALQQVLFNVLDNAAEASPDRVILSAGRTATSLTITVRDFGPGFSTEQLQRFGQPYTSSKRRLGSGLGLFLVVNVMRKLGGSVEAANVAGDGASVALTLPLAALALGETAHG